MHQVLLVDDEITLLTLLKRGLSGYSDRFSVLTAENGKQAVEIMNKETISVLVTDLSMPVMNGFELLSFAMEHFPGLPCIAMTAHDVSKMKQTLPKGLLGVMPKPFSIPDMAAAILKAMEKERPEGAMRGISVPGFVQLIALEQATTLVEVQEKGRLEKGLIFFEDGEAVNAKLGDVIGEEAAIRILAMDNAIIRMVKKDRNAIQKKIRQSLNSLILEAMRRKDEQASPEEST